MSDVERISIDHDFLQKVYVDEGMHMMTGLITDGVGLVKDLKRTVSKCRSISLIQESR